MNNHWKKAAALGLCASLLVAALSGCSKKNTEETFDTAKTAVTVNGDTVSAGLLKFATHQMQAQYETMYSYFGYTGVINQDMGTGQTLGESVKNAAVSSLEEQLLAEQHMADYGVSLTDDQKKQISEAASAFLAQNDADLLASINADQETVERYLTLAAEKALMDKAVVADVDREVSDEEAAQRLVHYTLFTTANEKESETESELESDLFEDVVPAEEETIGVVTDVVEEVQSEAAELVETAETAVEEAAEAAGEIVQTAETAVDEAAATLEENTPSKTNAAAETESEAVIADVVEPESEEESETEDEETRIAREKAYAKAEAMIALVAGGMDFEEASAQIDPDAYTSTLTFGEDDASTREELVTATNGLGDNTLVDHPVRVSSGYYVVYVDEALNREATDERKEEIIEERENEMRTNLYDEWKEAAEMSADDSVLSALTFTFSLMLDNGEEDAVEVETEAGETELIELAENESETAYLE